MLITNTFNIVMAVFDVAQHVVNSSAGLISGSTAVDTSTLETIRDSLEAMELGELGQDEAGKNVWEDKKTQIPNKELKAMVESYKARSPQEKETQSKESAVAALGKLTKDPESKRSVEKPRSKAKEKSPEL